MLIYRESNPERVTGHEIVKAMAGSTDTQFTINSLWQKSKRLGINLSITEIREYRGRGYSGRDLSVIMDGMARYFANNPVRTSKRAVWCYFESVGRLTVGMWSDYTGERESIG